MLSKFNSVLLFHFSEKEVLIAYIVAMEVYLHQRKLEDFQY